MRTVEHTVSVTNPYLGLRPFDEGDSELFFGREQYIDELLRRLEEYRFLAAIGLSGSGKSSLVRAGLLPALRKGDLPGGGAKWRVAVMRPGAEPIEALVHSLNQTVALGPHPDRLRVLEQSSLGLLQTGRVGRAASQSLLVVVDQFEEIFRFQRERDLSAERAAQFVELLLAATAERRIEYRTYVVLTMRTDYLGDCAQFRGLPEALNRGQYLVPRMTREQLRDAIEGPAAMRETVLAPQLVQRILTDSMDAEDQLPRLQHVLMRLWPRRIRGAVTREGNELCDLITPKEYDDPAIGGFDHALDLHAEELYGSVGESEQLLAKRAFERLTEIVDGRDRRCPTRIGQLAAVSGASRSNVERVVAHFQSADFLTSPDQDRVVDWEVDLAHESLIRQWKRLNTWAKQESESSWWYRRLAKLIEMSKGSPEPLRGKELEAAWLAREQGRWTKEWAQRYEGDYEAVDQLLLRSRREQDLRDERERELEEMKLTAEKQRAKFRLVLLWGAGCALALTAILALLAFQSWRKAESNAAEASRLKDEAVVNAVEASRLKDEAVVNAAEASRLKDEAVRNEDEAKSAEKKAQLLAIQRDQEARKAREALAAKKALEDRLIANSLAVASSGHPDLEVASLLAVESLRKATTPGGVEAYWKWFDKRERPVISGTVKDARSFRLLGFANDAKTLLGSGYYPKLEFRAISVDSGKSEPPIPYRPLTVVSPDQKYIGTAETKQFVLREVLGGEVLSHPGRVQRAGFSGDGRRLVLLENPRKVTVYEIESKMKAGDFSLSEDITFMQLDVQGERLATRSGSGRVQVINIADSSAPGLDEPYTELVTILGFSADKRLLMLRTERALYVRPLDGRAPPEPYPLTTSPPPFAVSAEGGSIIVRNNTGTSDEELLVFRSNDDFRKPSCRLKINSEVRLVTLDPKGSLAGVATTGGMVQLWRIEGGELIRRIAHDKVSTLAFSPDGRFLASGSLDGRYKVMKTAGDGPIPFSKSGGVVAFSPDGEFVALAKRDSPFLSLYTLDGQARGDPYKLDANVRVTSFKRGDATLVVGTAKAVWLLDVGGGLKPIRPLLTESTGSVSLSDDGRWLATVQNSKAQVRDLRSGSVREFPRAGVFVVTLSPDGRRLATVDQQWNLTLWDVDTRSELKTVRLFGRKPATARLSSAEGAFSADGNFLAAGTEKFIQIFDGRTLQGKARFPVGGSLAGGLDYTKSGLRAAVSNENSFSIRRYPVELNDLWKGACAILDRSLTEEEWREFLPDEKYDPVCARPSPQH